jgi:hypothetical protein
LHLRITHAAIGFVLLAATLLAPSSAVAAIPSDPLTVFSSGYRVDPAALKYVQQHGGVEALGFPISNALTLLGKRVQIFQRQALDLRPDGTVGTLNLVDGTYFPLARLGGASLAPDPDLMARLPAAASSDFYTAASAYLDETAPADWNGMPVQFGAAFRTSVRCPSDGTSACTARSQFGLANELWGLPIGRPTPDPHSTDYVYLWFQRGVLVYSRTASDTQWLLAGEILKRVLQGAELPQDMLAQISATASYARFYAQYDPLSRDNLARPAELPNSSLNGAFVSPQPPAPTASAAPVGPAAPARPAPPSTPSGLKPPLPPVASAAGLDPHFGVAEGFRAPDVMADLHVGWERLVIPWDQVQPDGPADFSHLGLTLSADRLRSDVARGVRVAAVLQFTPAWAQVNSIAGQNSVPKNLDLPFDDPANYWGRFVGETVKHYAGQIDEWIIWNEPEIRPTDAGNGGASSWAGTDEEFAQLLRVGYLAAKKANPSAVVSFPATSYWMEEQSRPKRAPFYERELGILSRDAHAAEHNFYHDAVGLNLYRSPDDIFRVSRLFASLQRAYNIDKPLWLTEMNAMPTDEAQSPAQCTVRDLNSGIKTTLDQQAAYLIQSFALAAAAGYQRAEFYKMIDGDNCREPAWGLVRANGTRRPVADAARMAIANFSNFAVARFVPLPRDQEAWSAWPTNPASYLPNWRVYQVALDRPGHQRVTALWNGDGTPLRVHIPKNGSSAHLVDRVGGQRVAREDAQGWVVDLPAATAHAALDEPNADPDGYYVIGGEPQLLVEDGVDPSMPVIPPRASFS